MPVDPVGHKYARNEIARTLESSHADGQQREQTAHALSLIDQPNLAAAVFATQSAARLVTIAAMLSDQREAMSAASTAHERRLFIESVLRLQREQRSEERQFMALARAAEQHFRIVRAGQQAGPMSIVKSYEESPLVQQALKIVGGKV